MTTTSPAAPASPSYAARTFAWRAWLRIRHVPEQLTDAIFVPILFTVMFTYLFGGALAGSTGAYLDYLLPGTLVLTVLLLTVYAGANLNADINRGVADRFRAMPIWRPAVIVGGLISDAGRNLLASSLVLGLGLAMGFRPDAGLTGVVAAVALVLVFGFGLSWVWATLGLVLRSAQAVTMVSFLVQFPLTFASNAFVEPATMPGWLQWFVDVNPVSHLVSAARGLVHGFAVGGDITYVLVASALLVTVFGPLTMRIYGRLE